MKEIQIKDLRKIQLDILDEVVKYCNDNGLRYFLAYGSLIGAIRHKGYIPWDDDIDIVMPRPDYEIFIKNFNSSYDEIKVFANELNKEFLYPFAKVSNEKTLLIEDSGIKFNIGVNIDIFPIDGISMNDNDILKKQRVYKRLLNIKIIKLNLKRSPFKNFILFFGKVILCWLSIRKINSKMIDISKTYCYNKEDYCCNISTGDPVDKPVPKYFFEETVNVLFEDKEYTTTKYYDDWLKSIYGNYKELPPEDKRVTHHSFKVFELNP